VHPSNSSLRWVLTEDTDDKLQKQRTGHLTERHLGNRKHRPKACKRQTYARAYWRERDGCGWTGKPTKPGRPDTNTSFNAPCIHRRRRMDHSSRCWSKVGFFVYENACLLSLLVFSYINIHKIV